MKIAVPPANASDEELRELLLRDGHSLTQLAFLPPGDAPSGSSLAADVCVIFDDGAAPLPGHLELCRQVQRHDHGPILVITTRSDEASCSAFLDAGADDLLHWPQGRPLLPRRLAMLRQARASREPVTGQDFLDRPDTVSKARYRAALNGRLDGFFLLESLRDDDGEIVDFLFVDANDLGAAMLGPPRQKIIGARLSELLPDLVQDGQLSRYARIVATGEVLEEESVAEDKGAVPRWFRQQVVPAGDGIAITAQDVTEQKQTAVALRKSEERLRALLAAIPDMVFQFDTNGVVTAYHSSLRDDLLLPPNELIGLHLAEVLPRDVADAFSEAIEKARCCGGVQMLEYSLTIDERVQWFEARLVMTRLGDIVAIVRNITERKSVDEALRQSESRLLEAQEVAKLGSWQYDILADETSWSHEMFRIWEMNPEEGAPPIEKILERIHPDDRKRWHEAVELSTRYGIPYEFEHRIVLPDGRIRHVLARGRAHRDENWQIVSLSGTGQDITERKEAEDQLREREERFRTLVANLPAVVYRCKYDQHWTMYYISDVIEDITGYPAWGFVDNLERSLASAIHPEDRRPVQEEIARATERREPFILEYRMLHADGTVRWVNERGQAIYGSDGEILHLDGVIFDITDIKRMHQQLTLNAQMASVGSLAAGVAHEINNPLAIMIANLEYVAEELHQAIDTASPQAPVAEIIADAVDMLTTIRQGADRVCRIVNDLRAFADAAEHSTERVDVRKVVDWALHVTADQFGEQITIVRDYEAVPPVWANEAGLVQVFVNLLVNAAQATDPQRPDGNRITVVIRRAAERRTLVEIHDQGVGMTSETLSHIFDPFFTTKPVGQGTGLGLFICQGIITGLGGEIEVDSTPGEGSVFRVFLPDDRVESWPRIKSLPNVPAIHDRHTIKKS